MSTNAKRLLVAISIMVVAAIGLDESSYALKAPHDASKNISCGDCHTRLNGGFRTVTSFNNLCFNAAGCHRASGGAPKKVLNTRNASNRFNSLPANYSAIKQVSHGWKIPNTNPNAGVPIGNAGLVGLAGAENLRVKNTGKILCTRCHRAMGTAIGYVIYDKFLRADPTGNYVCYQCHSARRIDNVREALQAGLDYSHPVEVNYSTAHSRKPDYFEATPKSASVFGYKTSASVRLYTTHESAQAAYQGSSRLAGKNKGAVVCQSCHGPIHSADSNPYTFDNISYYSRFGKYSTSQGSLLRMYPIAGPRASNNLCLSCHKVQTHRSFMCGRCHTPHKKPGEANRYLILENISTPYNGIRPVVFTSRSAMAARFGGYSNTFSRLNKVSRPVSNAICQVCHTGTEKNLPYHRNYSSPSGAVSRTHNYNAVGDKYNFCPQCHLHTSGFTPSGCGTCHNFPPSDTIGATDSFKHAKHTNGNVEPGQSADTFWKTGKVTDARSDTSYGFSCGRCHSPWAPYTATGGVGYLGKNHYGSSISQSLYTADVGFKIKTSINPLPWNPSDSAAYVYSNTNAAQDGSSPKWWGAGTAAECRNLYCHGQWYNGYTSNNPQARGTQACGKCHGASNTDPPGKTAGVNYGAHPRHVGSANSQQYGSGTPNFRCNACHSLTSNYNNETTVTSRKYHVNGRVNIKFDNGSSSSFRAGNANSKYDGSAYNNYTTRKPAMSVKPAYKTCSLIYCHSRGNRLQGNYSAPNNASIGSGPARFPNWSSSRNFTTTMSIGGYTMKTRCARCHGNAAYKGITMAMPNYTSNQYGGAKENSHRKHVIENNFRCNVCHSSTINSANNTIANTRNHVNRFYNISIISTYRNNGVGNNYDNINKNCSSITCHAGKTTPKWGNKIGCADCHLNNAVDYDKRILNKQAFQNFSEAAPKIYSGAWADSGHGRQAASGNYYGKDSDGNNNGNLAANRICTNCHKTSVPHNTASNPFRLYTTHGGNPNALCEDCHGLNPGNPDAPQPPTSKARGIQTHASTVVGSVKYNFAMKCIDCHDPHGDNNILMLHSSVARPKITSGTRREMSDLYGRLLTNITTRNIDFVDNQYTTNYARKYGAPKICQNCHTQTRDVSAPYSSRFRWNGAGDKTHGSSKCTNCHTHAKGFKGEGCDGCHGWPPTSLQNIISGVGRINPTKKRASGSVTAGAHFKHFTTFINVGTPGLSRTTVCALCHKGGMYPNGSEDRKIELGFNAFGVYTTGKYRGQSAVATGYYGYSGAARLIGTGSGNNDTTYRCQNVKCHGAGWLTKNFGNVTTPRWDDASRNSVFCGSCHGAKKESGSGTWPTSNRHAIHAGTNTSNGEYDFMCRVCHSDTVMGTATTLNKFNHVNGKATFKFYTGAFTQNRVWSGSSYSGDDVVNSGWGKCLNLYCHSRGTKMTPSYANTTGFPNYTAKWDTDLTAKFPSDVGKRCSFCHGNMTYNGITAAMPNYTSSAYGGPKENSHRKHVVASGLKCNFCHSATINSANNDVTITGRHVNKFYNITILSIFKSGPTNYSTTVSAKKTCKNVTCHGGKTTPKWGNTIICQNCHLSASSDADDFTFNNYSRTIAQIYSSDWTKRGHGKSRSSGKYAFSNNSGAAKGCTNCHKPAVKHGDTNNYFRLYTSNSDRLCLSCHGKGTELNSWGLGFSDVTGIQTHSWYNISTAGYVSQANGSNVRKATLYGGWSFGQHDGTDQKKVKCVDCHDPHGDRNNYMIHSYINMSGSDRVGRPNPNNATAQAVFTAVGGPQMNWSSYVRTLADGRGLCQRCHSAMSNSTAMTNFNKGKYSNHNRGTRCTVCHKHRQGFKPSGCAGCHNYPPPDGPLNPNDWNEKAATPATVGLHEPHAWNRRQRPGIPTNENDVDTKGNKGADERGFNCNKCHANTTDGAASNMGDAGNVNAIMTQLTSVYGDWIPGFDGISSVTDDTCSKITCHTPRYYTRQWKKPADCDDCHGYRNRANSETFKIQTTGSHKIHVNYSTPTIAGTDFKKYGLRCSNCHYDWQGLNNYSTHYSSYVNITANGPINTIANMKVKEGQFYTKGRLFKGFTTGNESFGTCAKAYCHGNFTNGTTATLPNWKKGVSPVTCTSCHKGRLTFGNGSTMPERHQKHVKTNQYGFACAKCHTRTTNNITTIIFNYTSAHVNGRKDIYFNSDLNNGSGSFNPAVTSRQCSNTYCHSKGYRSAAGSFITRTTIANYTADWDVTAEGRAGTNKGCSFCHGNKTYNGITAAMPNQTSLWGNSHRTHVIRNNFRCSVCHSATVNAAGRIATYGNHVNGFKNITIIAAYKDGQTLYSSQVPSVNKSCKNVRCHAGKTTPKWGTYIKCQDCHLSSTDDADKRISANNSFQSFTAKVNPKAPRIYSTAWATQGHGRQSAFPSGNPAANRICTDCHKASVKHGTAGNPFRLYTINSVTGSPNTLCEDCHGVNPGNLVAYKKGIQTHASSVTQTGRGYRFAMKCVDCHDPHGDNNTFMVHSAIARPYNSLSWKESSNTYGSLLVNITSRNVDFTQGLYTSDYAKKVKKDKICQVCHTKTFKPGSSALTRFRWYSSKDMSHGVGKCTSCHSHGKGFKGAKCNDCHGYPPTSLQTILSGAGNPFKQRASGSNTAGAHGKHTSIFGASNAVCSYCHSGGMADTGSDNDDITLKFAPFGYYTGVNQKYTGQAAVRSGFYGYSGDGITTGNTLRCESVKCHGGGGWLTKSFGSPTAPKWNDTTRSTVFCGSCHGARKSSTVGTWPTTKAHVLHAGTSIRQQDLMCKTCHSITVLNSATTLSKAKHVDGNVYVNFSGTNEPRVDKRGTYSGDTVVNSGFGKCANIYCHSKGTDRVAPYSANTAYSNWTARWDGTRGSYRPTNVNTDPAKCNYCHGNTSFGGVTAAMPNYNDGSPKANKHPKHVKDYGFLCSSCHDNVVANNTSIKGSSYGLHVNRVYNVDFAGINSQGRYTSSNSGCRNTYCHSKGTKTSAPYTNTTALANYTAHWGDSRGSYYSPSAGMAKCNYCHGSRGTQRGMTSAMPNYNTGTPKANRHPIHVRTYGFTCTVCHEYVTTNNTSIDAPGGMSRHVNQSFNVDFNRNARAGFTDNTGTYRNIGSLGGGVGSKCVNTYCHSRGTDLATPFNTRTSFANWTARWGDTRGGYRPVTIGQKAKCNYCHGNRVFGGVTAAMPNYSSAATNTAKWNTHPIHVRTYGFTCTICHNKVTANNTSIDAAGGTALHVNKAYNVYFKANVRDNLTNNTGVYVYTDLATKNKCKNTYCHSRGTDLVKPYNTRTSFSNWTARWGDTRGSYKQAAGQKAKCNYCHGNRAYSGMTSAMPNYSGNVNAVKAKANSHRVHVINNGFVCSTCHYGVVRNNTSISDRLSHVNGFYNISITPTQKSAAGKAYSTNWTDRQAGGTCMNNKCHGTSKPQWGNPNSANCKACHFSGTADTDNYARVGGQKAEIYSSEWRRKGHGQFAAFTSRNINRCERCHNPGVSHNYAQSPVSNPFRLWTSQPDGLCGNCHGVPAERSATRWNNSYVVSLLGYTGILTHSKANTSGNASWDTHSSVKGKGAKCIDCHDPHGDKNKKMIHAYINHSGSDRFGRPAGRPWTTFTSNVTAQMTFTSHGGYGGLVGWSSFANNNVNRSICRRCHTVGDSGLAVPMNKGNYEVGHQDHSEKCTANCHKHKTGFKPAGESGGDLDCGGCHGSSDLLGEMQSPNGYHHVMSNTSVGNPKYPNVSSFGPSDQKSSKRRCLMCHVDHNVFRPDINTDGTGGRAKNLRWSVLAQGNRTGINTDFWPAKRKNATGRTGTDLGSGNYSSTYPISGPSTFNGVCISCHKNIQYKNTSMANDDIGTSRARNFPVSLYTSSSHNFQVISGTFVFGSSGRSSFRGNCVKCHRTPNPNGNFNSLSKPNAQQGYGRFPVALHDKNVPSLLMEIATSSSKPQIEELCYNCHDTLAKSAGGPGSMDFYSSIKMNSGAKMIKTAVTGKRYTKPIADDAMAGMHKIDEYYKAVTSVAENSNPSVLWNYSTGAAGGVGRHIECVDCHNTHGGNASIRRLAGAPFIGKLNTQQASYFNYTRDTGNKIAGAQKGVWGVSLSYGSTRGTTPKFKKIAQVTYQYEVCLKCHSRYAYGTNPPGVPDGLPDPGTNHVLAFDNLVPDVPQADISRMINPNNYGYHPIFKKGRNQPPDNANTNWPGAKSNWMYKDRFNNKTAFISVSGLSWNFVPPFSQHSLLACTDCHVADNSGKVVQRFKADSNPTTGGTGNWSGTATKANIEKNGDNLAAVVTGAASATLSVSVTNGGNTPGTSPETNGLMIVVYGRTSSTGSANTRTQTLEAFDTGVLIGSGGTVTFAKGTSTAIGRYEYSPAWTFEEWNFIESDYTVKITTNAGTYDVTIDYIGLDITHPTTADVRGPHGSMERWLLTDLDTDVWFDANNSNTLTYDTVDRPNTPGKVSDVALNNSKVFCWNCHRKDVYSDTPKYQYSRLDHTAGNTNPWFEATNTAWQNAWGIVCMNCHAGGGIGEIHGSFQNSTTPSGGADDGGVNWGTSGGINTGRPRGVRLLNGAQFNFDVINSKCYNPNAATPYGGTCSSHTTGTAATTNYTYTSW